MAVDPQAPGREASRLSRQGWVRGLRLDSGRMSSQATSADRRASDGQSDEDLREELARKEREILRLRDLLISKDVELGAAKGRLAELDERSRRASAMAALIQARVPGLGRVLGKIVRLLRSQQA